MNEPSAFVDRRRLIAAAAAAGVAAAVAGAIAWVTDPRTFFAGYLVAAVWVWSLAFGGLCLALLFHLTGGRWGEVGRPWFDVAARSMPLVMLMFVPLAFGLHHLYPWTDPEFFAGMESVEHRQWYYTSDFFLIRSAVYFAVWIVLGVWVAGLPGHRHRPRPVAGGQAAAGLGAIALLLTVTWAAMDWLMSLDPLFYSALFGGLIGGGALLSGLAFVVAGVTWGPGAAAARIRRREDPKPLADLANLLLAMVMLWAYFSFSQLLLMWSANLPEEAKWYLARSTGGWQTLPILFTIGGFALPLAALMSSRLKRSPGPLGLLALWLIAIRWVELDWFVLPHFSPHDFSWNWCALVMPIATGGIWLAYVAWDVARWGIDVSTRGGRSDDE